MSEVPKKSSEFSKMRAAEFANFAMHNHVAPRSMGSVKTRLSHVQRILGKRKWTANRVRDLWYLDRRASEPKWNEIRDLEEITGLQYARRELDQTNDAITRANALIAGSGDPDFYSAFAAAVLAFFGARDSARTEGTGRSRSSRNTD